MLLSRNAALIGGNSAKPGSGFCALIKAALKRPCLSSSRSLNQRAASWRSVSLNQRCACGSADQWTQASTRSARPQPQSAQLQRRAHRRLLPSTLVEFMTQNGLLAGTCCQRRIRNAAPKGRRTAAGGTARFVAQKGEAARAGTLRARAVMTSPRKGKPRGSRLWVLAPPLGQGQTRRRGGFLPAWCLLESYNYN